MIDSGTATGATLLQITNSGGSGALTTGDGILVVQTINSATTDPGSFALSGRAAAGAYEYLLFYGGRSETGGNSNDQNWYLRSTLIPTPTPDNPIRFLFRTFARKLQ